MSIAVAYRWELRKLAAQKRTYLGLVGMALLPVIFTVSVLIDGGEVDGALFGRVTESGLATPVLLLFFASVFLFPLAAALVAGAIVASKDHHGRFKTIVTRAIDLGAKALAAFTYAALALLLFAAVAVAAAVAAWGLRPLTSLSGSELPVPLTLLPIWGALLAYLLPLMTVASIALLLSTVARNGAAAVVGTLLLVVLMQIVAGIPGTEAVRPYLLPDQFDAWQGLYSLPCLLIAAAVFRRRDVTDG